MNNIRIGIRLGAAFGFMALLVVFMVLIGIVKINSLGNVNDEISGSLYTKYQVLDVPVIALLHVRHEPPCA